MAYVPPLQLQPQSGQSPQQGANPQPGQPQAGGPPQSTPEQDAKFSQLIQTGGDFQQKFIDGFNNSNLAKQQGISFVPDPTHIGHFIQIQGVLPVGTKQESTPLTPQESQDFNVPFGQTQADITGKTANPILSDATALQYNVPIGSRQSDIAGKQPVAKNFYTVIPPNKINQIIDSETGLPAPTSLTYGEFESKNPDGTNKYRELTTQDQTKFNALDQAMAAISASEKNLSEGGGAQGPLLGDVTKSWFGTFTNPKGKAYEGSKTETAATLAKAVTGGSRAPESIQHQFISALPSVSDTPALATEKYNVIRNQIYAQAKIAGNMKLLVDNGVDPNTLEKNYIFNNEKEAEAAKLPPGTSIIIGGKHAIVN